MGWTESNWNFVSHISDVKNIQFPDDSFDAMALIYTHFPGDKGRSFHQKIVGFVKPEVYLVIEGFFRLQEEYQKKDPKAGGPWNTEMLYDLKELKEDFSDFDIKEVYIEKIILNEENYHNGEASVVRLFAQKK